MNRLQLIICFLAISVTFTMIKAQTPCSSGMAGAYPCSNIDLSAHVNIGTLNAGSTGANDIWGWTDPATNIEYAIIGLRNGTSFVDISVPATPDVIGFLPSHNPTDDNTWRDIKIVNDHAYIGSEVTGHGVQIFDLSRLDTYNTPLVDLTEDGWIDLSGSNDNTHNLVANDLTDYLYTVGTNTCSGGLTFYNASNPLNPVNEGCYSSDGYAHDAVCFVYRGLDTDHTGKEICIGLMGNSGVFTIVDVTDKSNPIKIKSLTYAGQDYVHQGWITEDQKYLLVADELDEGSSGDPTTTYIFDIADLDNPSLKYTFESTLNATDHNLFVRGPYVFQSNYRAGLRILDVSDLDNSAPVEVAYFDIYPSSNNSSSGGAWGVFPYFNSDQIIISGISGATTGGLFIVEPQLPHYTMIPIGTGVDTICASQSASFTFDMKAYAGFTTSDQLTLTGLPGAAVGTFNANPAPPNSILTLTISNTGGLASGNYPLTITGTELPVNRVNVSLIVDNPPNGTNLIAPASGLINVPIMQTFSWQPVSGATVYEIQVSTDPTFATVDFSEDGLTNTSYTFNNLAYGENYFWRVITTAIICSTPSVIWEFRTIENPVPVELIDLTATALEDEILIKWSTASEINNLGFEVQRNHDMSEINFEKIGWLPAADLNSNSVLRYALTDSDVERSVQYYYRLKQTDYDGAYEYSPIVSARLDENKPVALVYPNPANDQISIQIAAASLLSGTAQLTVHDLTGRKVLERQIDLNDFSSSYSLKINHLAKGTYLLNIAGAQINLPVRFVKF